MKHVRVSKKELIDAIRTMKKLYHNTSQIGFCRMQEDIVRYAFLAARFGKLHELGLEDAKEIMAEYKRPLAQEEPLD